ncbi:mitochondrial Complex1_LYR_2 family protein [Andalucia godoyi]|uniref:Mitochondrial Complex1_LYR_2 family protein n=1 Tax=Andalucia godoyi TaxID=505711 RepID=A0A8K0AJX1_ANDGO|nr:mitochondrial Complex1_LYR_2 family protein [Andalucia godoyi]|eukprot:ANDGO_06492.mRNA.1 mitochondrial Complex1_LYR_2 family protein
MAMLKRGVQSHRGSVLALYKRCLRLAPDYVRAPGVQSLLQQEFLKEESHLSAVSAKGMKSQLTNHELMTELVRNYVAETFRANARMQSGKEAARMLREAKAEVSAIETQVIQRGWPLPGQGS